MAFEMPLFSISRTAGADLSAKQFTGVVLNSSGQIVTPGAGVDICGVLQDKPASGSTGNVRVHGVTKMVVGTGGVTAGDKLAVDANGKAVTATTGNFVVGQALETGAAGVTVSVLLRPGGKI